MNDKISGLPFEGISSYTLKASFHNKLDSVPSICKLPDMILQFTVVVPQISPTHRFEIISTAAAHNQIDSLPCITLTLLTRTIKKVRSSM